MSNLSTILVPVSQSSPCGDDLFESYEGGFYKLVNAGLGILPESAVEGQQVQSSTPTGVAAWRTLEEQLLGLFKQTKHVDMLYLLALAEGHLHGLAGLAEALDYANLLLEQQWPHLHPIEPDYDYEFRQNCLTKLDAPAFADCLNPLLIADGRQLGKHSLGDWLKARKNSPDQLNTIEQALLETLKDRPTFYDDLAAELNELNQSLDRFELTVKQMFSGFRLSFNALKTKLAEIARLIVGFSDVPVAGVAAALPPQAGGTGTAPGPAVPDQILSREDVVKTLAKIILYYSKNEPTSPVPAMLERAQRVATMNFREIVQEFNLTGTPAIQDVLGWKTEE